MAQLNTQTAQIHSGVTYARIAGRLIGLLICAMGLYALSSSSTNSYGGPAFELFRGVYFIVFGFILNVPFSKIPERFWKKAFAALVVVSVGFVFTMIASVMFGYMAAADQGERLGVPGFEGTLIFLSLMQVPAILFERRPDLLD